LFLRLYKEGLCTLNYVDCLTTILKVLGLVCLREVYDRVRSFSNLDLRITL